jgi:hypothetical protein
MRCMLIFFNFSFLSFLFLFFSFLFSLWKAQCYIPIRPNDENIPIHRQVLSIPTAHIQTHGSRLETLQETLNNRPGLCFVKKIHQHPVAVLVQACILYTASTKSAKQSARKPCARVLPRRPHLWVLLEGTLLRSVARGGFGVGVSMRVTGSVRWMLVVWEKRRWVWEMVCAQFLPRMEFH